MMGRDHDRVPSSAATGCSVEGNLGETGSAYGGNHRPSSSIDTNVNSGGGERALSALLYTHKIAHKTNEIPDVVTENYGEKTWLWQGEVGK